MAAPLWRIVSIALPLGTCAISVTSCADGDRKGLWRHRVGNYRIVAAIEDDRFVVLVVTVGHRREVYG